MFLNNALLYNAQMMINNGLILFSFFEMLMLLSLSLLFVFSGRRVDDSSGDFGDVEMVSARTASVRKSAKSGCFVVAFARQSLFQIVFFSRCTLEHSGNKHIRHVHGFFFEDVFADGWDP